MRKKKGVKRDSFEEIRCEKIRNELTNEPIYLFA